MLYEMCVTFLTLEPHEQQLVGKNTKSSSRLLFFGFSIASSLKNGRKTNIYISKKKNE